MNSAPKHQFSLWARSFLFNSGRTQSELANQVNLSNTRLSEIINNSKGDIDSNNAREHILKMIWIYHQWGVLYSQEQANEGLEKAGQAPLGYQQSELETKLIKLLINEDTGETVDQKNKSQKRNWPALLILTVILVGGLYFLINSTRPQNANVVISCSAQPGMVFIEEGPFKFGSTSQEINEFAKLCPADDSSCSSAYFTDELANQSDLSSDENSTKQTLHLSSFCIDQYEVSVLEYSEFVEATNYETLAEINGHSQVWNDERRQYETKENVNWKNPDGDTTNIARISEYPVTHVSWYDAKAYCEWNGMRLPTIYEWEKASRGTNGDPYPWGDEWDESISNYYILNKSTIEPVGTRPQNVSPYGVFDTVGNVLEWTNTIDPEGEKEPNRVERRGGSYLSNSVFHHVAWRNFSSPLSTNQALGFRCVHLP